MGSVRVRPRRRPRRRPGRENSDESDGSLVLMNSMWLPDGTTTNQVHQHQPGEHGIQPNIWVGVGPGLESETLDPFLGLGEGLGCSHGWVITGYRVHGQRWSGSTGGV